MVVPVTASPRSLCHPPSMEPESENPLLSDADPAQRERLAWILRRVEVGDTSVTDEVFWLQAHTDFVTAKARPTHN